MKHHYCLPLAITTLLLLLHSTTAKIVEDNIGNPLIPGGEYFIVPYSAADGSAGLAWKEILNPDEYCPKNYIYQLKGFDYGQPTSFHPIDPNQKQIISSTNLNIVFPNYTPPQGLPFFCPTVSNVWKMQGKEVSLGGQMGGRSTKSLFTISDLGRGKYGLNYCGDNLTGCRALGFVTKDGERRLVIGGKRLEVVFATEKPFLKQVVNVA